MSVRLLKQTVSYHILNHLRHDIRVTNVCVLMGSDWKCRIIKDMEDERQQQTLITCQQFSDFRLQPIQVLGSFSLLYFSAQTNERRTSNQSDEPV